METSANTTNDLNALFEESDDIQVNNLDNDIDKNVDQIDLLLNLINRTSASSVANKPELITQLNKKLNNLKDLVLYYKNKCVLDDCDENKLTNDEAKFIQYLIIKRINSLNDVFNLHKKLIFSNSYLNDSLSNQTVANSLNSPLIYLNDYEQFETFEINLNNNKNTIKFNLKLNINGIRLDDVFKVENGYLNLNSDEKKYNDEFCFFVYQFDEFYTKISQLKKLHQDNNGAKTKPNPKLATKSGSKRSSSADPNINKRKTKPDIESKLIELNKRLDEESSSSKNSNDSSSEKSEDSDSDSEQNTKSKIFKLSEKCLMINSFKFKCSDLNNKKIPEFSNSILKSVDIKPNCNKVIVILYKLFKINQSESNAYEYFLKIPIKYELFKINDGKLELKRSYNNKIIIEESIYRISDDLKPISNKTPLQIANEKAQVPNHSNVFRRMFNKSKSTTRAQSSKRAAPALANPARDRDVELKNELILLKKELSNLSSTIKYNNLKSMPELNSQSFLSLALTSNEQMEKFLNTANLINIDLFHAWRKSWEPSINTNQIKFNNNEKELNGYNKKYSNHFEIVNIYLNSLSFKLKQSAHNHRSKLAQHQMGISQQNDFFKDDSYYFIQIKLDNHKFIKILNDEFSSCLDAAKSEYVYTSNLFKMSQSLNDVCQIAIEFGYNLNTNVKIKFELHKLILIRANLNAKLIGYNYLILNRNYFNQIKKYNLDLINHNLDNDDLDLKLLKSPDNMSLKLKFLFMSKYYPFKQSSIDLFEFNLVDSSQPNLLVSFDKEKVLFNLIEVYLKNFHFDIILIRKFLEFFSYLNINSIHKKSDLLANNFNAMNLNENDSTDKRLLTRNLLLKIYEGFIRLIFEYDINKTHRTLVDLKQLINNLCIQSRYVIQSLLAILKLLIETDFVDDKLSYLFELTLKCFNYIIEILVVLSKSSNSNYQLKYDLNELITKLIKQFNLKQKLIIYSKLNFNFLDYLNDLFNGTELANLICSKMFNVNGINTGIGSEEQYKPNPEAINDFNSLVIKIINDSVFNLSSFHANYQFRDKLVEFVIANYLNFEKVSLNNETSYAKMLNGDQVMLIKNLLKIKYKLSKQNLDNLIKSTFKLIIYSLINCFKLYEQQNDLNTNPAELNNETNSLKMLLLNKTNYLIDNFLCLIEILDFILSTKTNKLQPNAFYLENLSDHDLINLFEIIIYYFKLNKFNNKFIVHKKSLFYTSNCINNQHKLWLNVNMTIFKFAKQIQKYLLRYLISKFNDDNEQSVCLEQIQTAAAATVAPSAGENLIKLYFEMMFIYVDQPTVSVTLTMRMKLNVLQCLFDFWKNFNIKLKRSTYLNEFILSRICECFVKNLYFKIIPFQLNNNRLHKALFCLTPFMDQNSTTNLANTNKIYVFYELMIRFINELYLNSLLEFDSFNEFIYLSLMSTFVRNDKNKRKNMNSSISFENDHKAELLIKNEDGLFINCTNENMSLSKSSSKVILEFVETILTRNSPFNLNDTAYFLNEPNRKRILTTFKLCLEYSLLKEEYELESSISVVEKFVFVYDLVKFFYNLNTNNKLFSNSGLESRQKIQMHLLDDLYQLHRYEKNYLQMSFIRKEQADLLEWDFSKKGESDLKEILYLKSLKKFAINSLHDKFLMQETALLSEYYKSIENANNAEQANETKNEQPNNFFNSIQFEICKKLCGYYEKLDENYSKFSRILNAESKFAQLASTALMKSSIQQSPELVKSNHHGHLYFRIGFFGLSLKFESIRNKYFLYKHPTYEMLSNIQNLMLNKLSHFKWNDSQLPDTVNSKLIHNVCLLHHNQEPEASVKENLDKCFVQICAVNKLEKSKLAELVDEIDDEKECAEVKSKLSKYDKNVYFYYFDRPFYKNNESSKEAKHLSMMDDVEEYERAKEHESVDNLWLERSVLITDEISFKYDNITQFEEIKSIVKILLNPIRNAISDINEKTKELKHFVVQFTTNNNSSNNCGFSNLNVMHSLQPLTMRLLGCLDARVNGGLIKYVKELLNESLVGPKICKKKKVLFYQLYMSIKDQLNVLESGLSIHDRILKDVEARFKDLTSANAEIDSKYLKNFEHIKHMKELNKHLIDCLRVIENELNERWSKFC